VLSKLLASVIPSQCPTPSSSYEHAFSHDTGLLAFTQTALTHLPPNAHVLDVGWGTGKPIATALAAAGHRVTCIDISDAMVELSRKVVPSGAIEVADMRDLFQRNDWTRWLEVGGVLCTCTLVAKDYDPEGKGKGYDADGKCARDIGFRFMGE
jgi:SAM-dependent methyltransferase